MTPLTIRVLGQPQLEHKLQGLAEALDTRRILDEGAALLFNRMRSRFLQQTSPTGSKWPISQAAQRRAATGRGGGTLFDTGKLWESLQIYADTSTTRAIGTNRTSATGFPYPIIHQRGLAGFPEREFIGFGTQDVTLMTHLILQRLIAGLSK